MRIWLWCQQRFSPGPLSRGGPGQGAAVGSRAVVGWKDLSASSESASEPSDNLAPRLDRRDTTSLGPAVISSSLPDAARGVAVHVERVVVCSRAVSGGSRRLVRRAAIAAPRVARRRGAGVGCKASRRYRASAGGRAAAARAAAALSATAAGAGSGDASADTRRRARASASVCRRRFCRADVRSAGLLRHVLGDSTSIVPAFLQCGVPPGVTSRAGSGGTLSAASPALAT